MSGGGWFVELMVARRKLLAQKPKSKCPYITNGLELWLDGIDKGSVADAWVDQVSGVVFTAVNGVTFNTNSVTLDSSQQQYLFNTNYEPPFYTDATLEVVLSGKTNLFSSIIFSPYQSNKIGLEVYNSGIWRALWATSTSAQRARLSGQYTSFNILSINLDRCVVNGGIIAVYDSNQSMYKSSNANYIGIAYGTSFVRPLNGNIHSIRIYTRKLSESEILQNQRVDNDRFNLGLTI